MRVVFIYSMIGLEKMHKSQHFTRGVHCYIMPAKRKEFGVHYKLRNVGFQLLAYFGYLNDSRVAVSVNMSPKACLETSAGRVPHGLAMYVM